MSTSPISVSTFNGTSPYAADLQQAITHAVAIASLPLNDLTNTVSTLQGQSIEVSTLQTKFSALQSAIQNLASATGSGGLTASVADNTVASVALDSTQPVAPGTYTIKVTSVGAPTSTLSNTGLPTVADPTSTSISTSSSFSLTVGASTYTITPSGNSLSALAQAINASGGAVNASIVNIGPPSAPDYRLSLQSTDLGNVAIQLNDGTNLLSVLTPGSPARYQVDGQPATPISSGSSTVTIAPGVSVDLLAAGQTTVTVSANPSAPASALSNFATAYNAAVDELSQNHGSAGGALTGNSILLSLEQSLQSLTGYTGGSGSVQSLTDLGLAFDQTGHLSFNLSQFSSVDAAHPSDVASFLGSASGSGFLNGATNILNGLQDPTNGLFQGVNSDLSQQITTDNQKITEDQAGITTLQNNLVAQMSTADAAIATLESQVTYFTGLFAATLNATQNNALG
jgi:flagellar hook-associated protein 2